jgi:1,4-dihydroxy-2-naphthoate octaprenyltransferase
VPGAHLSYAADLNFFQSKLKQLNVPRTKTYFCDMNRIKIWLKAFRLRTLPLSLSGIILGSFIAKADGHWDTSIFILSLVTTILFQVLSNLANDLGDYQKGTDNENRVGPARSTQSGEISEIQMKKAVIFFVILSVFTATALIWLSSVNISSQTAIIYGILGVLSIAAAILYTVGKHAYGYNGMGDIMVFIFFGLVSVVGVYGLYGGELHSNLFLAAITIGLLSVAVLNLNNLRDHENDKAMGKNTLVVMMGFKNAKLYHASVLLIAITAFTFFLTSYSKWSFVSLIFAVPLLFHLERILKAELPSKIDPELKKVALITFGISLTTAILIQ